MACRSLYFLPVDAVNPSSTCGDTVTLVVTTVSPSSFTLRSPPLKVTVMWWVAFLRDAMAPEYWLAQNVHHKTMRQVIKEGRSPADIVAEFDAVHRKYPSLLLAGQNVDVVAVGRVQKVRPALAPDEMLRDVVAVVEGPAQP